MPAKKTGKLKDTSEAIEPLKAGFDARFQKLGLLGRGGMGDVLRVRERGLRRVVAIKVIQGHSWQDPASRRRFFTEAKVTAQLGHPNIIPIYGFEWTHDGRPAFSMKLIDGRTFHQYIEDCTADPGNPENDLGNRIDHFLKVCDALAYSHNRGVLHRDLKPENLMVGRFNEVYVMDWGIAKVVDSPSEDTAKVDEPTEDPTKTALGDVFGTPSYMSPEQAAGETIGPASDQYALGLVLFELVTLMRANAGETSHQAWANAIHGRIRPIAHKFGQPISQDLKAIIKKATDPVEENRYPDVAALAEDLRRFQRKQEVSANPDGLFRKLVRWAQTKPLLLMGSAAGSLLFALLVTVVGLLALIGMLLWSNQRERQTAAIVHAADRQGHAIDNVLIRHQATLESLSEMAEHMLSNGRLSDRTIYHRDRLGSGEVPADWGPSARYGYPSTFTDLLVLHVPGIDKASVEPTIRRLLPISEAYRDAALRSHSSEAPFLPKPEIHKLLSDTGVPIAWLYIGLEEGVLLNWPGNNEYGIDYDPRKRPWYTAARDLKGTRWGELYQGASGFSILLPCNRALHNPQGEVIGVAGLDVALDDIIALLKTSREDVLNSYLVDTNGQIVVSTVQKGLNLGPGIHNNQTLEQDPFPFPSVRNRILAGEDSGWVDEGSQIITFDRLAAVDWYFVTVVRDGWF